MKKCYIWSEIWKYKKKIVEWIFMWIVWDKGLKLVLYPDLNNLKLGDKIEEEEEKLWIHSS
jgi:hypothetical protein